MLYCNECNFTLLHANVAEKRDGYRHLVMLCTNCGACMEVEETTIRKADPAVIGKKQYEVGKVRRLVDQQTGER